MMVNESKSAQKVTRLQIVKDIEAYINRYVSFQDAYSLPIALWVLGTYCFPSFDAFPYMVVTSETKRSGKSRLGIELMNFVASNPRAFTAMTPSTMFNIIEAEHPTVLFDEAETLSGESQSVMTQVLNAGYRKGTRIPRMVGKDQIKEFDTYSPKVFVLIGDVRDTLRDRSIIVRMKRAEAPTRFVYEVAKMEGATVREMASEQVEAALLDIGSVYMNHKGIEFLTDRDEEIWTPIFTLCQVFCPERLHELERIAVDMATEKTATKKRYVDLGEAEDAAQDDEYKLRLLSDMLSVMSGKNTTSQDMVSRLRELPTAPWRKFRGDGITMHNIADMVSQFGLTPVPIRIGKLVAKGYKLETVRTIVKKYVK
jgi:hypothetical protein